MLDQLQTLEPDGEPPKSRIENAQSAYQLWGALRQADYASSYDRARIDALYDGEPPFSDSQLQATGQSFRVNVNWDFAGSLLETAMSGYVDILNSPGSYFRCPTTYGNESERRDYERIIAEEVTATIRSWDDFDATEYRLCNTFIKHGVGITYFMDEYDWRWQSSDLSDFKLPRKTKVGQTNVECACCLRFYSPTELYRLIQDEEKAELLGFNVAECKAAIMNCINTGNNFTQFSQYDWEKLEIELKNNDLIFSNGSADNQTIRVVNMWVTEYDGRVSHFLFRDDEQTETFLYKKIGRFADVYEAYTLYTYGVGTNGYYHSIRGQGWKTFPQVQALNRLYCQALDGTMLASSIMVQPGDEDDTQNLQLVYYGPYAILPSGMKILERPAVPNISQAVFPVISGMSQMIRDKTGSYNVQQFLDDNREKTKFQVQAELGAQARMSVSSLNLFYGPQERKLRESLRRMMRREYDATDPGGQYVVKLKKRLLARGVPLEAFYALDLDRFKIVKAIGAGSEAARMLAMERLGGLAGSFDDEGRANWLHDMVAVTLDDPENAERYAPKPGTDPRQPIDAQFAQLENNQLLTGAPVEVLPNQNNLVHARIHLMAMQPLVEQGQQAPESVAQILPGLNNLANHTQVHVEKISQDPLMKVEAAQMRQMLQQANEIIHNGLLHVEKLQREAAEAAQAAPQEGQVDPAQQKAAAQEAQMYAKIQGEMMYRKAKLETMQAETEQKLAARQAEFSQKLALQDAEQAHKIARGY